MDPHRFDDFTRAIASRSTRRSFLGISLVGAASSILEAVFPLRAFAQGVDTICSNFCDKVFPSSNQMRQHCNSDPVFCEKCDSNPSNVCRLDSIHVDCVPTTVCNQTTSPASVSCTAATDPCLGPELSARASENFEYRKIQEWLRVNLFTPSPLAKNQSAAFLYVDDSFQRSRFITTYEQLPLGTPGIPSEAIPPSITSWTAVLFYGVEASGDEFSTAVLLLRGVAIFSLVVGDDGEVQRVTLPRMETQPAVRPQSPLASAARSLKRAADEARLAGRTATAQALDTAAAALLGRLGTESAGLDCSDQCGLLCGAGSALGCGLLSLVCGPGAEVCFAVIADQCAVAATVDCIVLCRSACRREPCPSNQTPCQDATNCCPPCSVCMGTVCGPSNCPNLCDQFANASNPCRDSCPPGQMQCGKFCCPPNTQTSTYTCCGDQCVDIQNDKQHCGDCRPCRSGQICRGGTCQCPAPAFNCGGVDSGTCCPPCHACINEECLAFECVGDCLECNGRQCVNCGALGLCCNVFTGRCDACSTRN
jgi:hypothetical protein